jgi:phosphatidylserine/phosphatidylglycerophosphate/cardiolipin synthase-like enzyme
MTASRVAATAEVCQFGSVYRSALPASRPSSHLRGVRLQAVAGGRTELGWFLTREQRGNDATRIQPWTDGNAVRPLVHGSRYFAVLSEVLAQAGEGDLVLFTDWRGDPDEKLTDDGTTVAEEFSAAVRRGAVVKGLIWRSHLDRFRFSSEENRNLSECLNDVGGEVLLDQRVRSVGSHHQKFVVVRHPGRPADDVALLGGIDLAHGRRDDAEHRGDAQGLSFAHQYGPRPPWHDVQVEIRGPAVRDIEDVFRERWEDPAALSRLPWQVVPDLVRRDDRQADTLPAQSPTPPAAGTCSVQLLRTYPQRHPGYPFAPHGERSAARGYAKALRRARRLVYVEDQYLWSADVAQVFAAALRREPGLHLVAVVPRYPDDDSRLSLPPMRLGHARALEIVRAAGGDRVQVLDVENRDGTPVYVHAKVCVIDDVWATVGSHNLTRRSWTHDSELTAAILDQRLDGREPRDPAGLGDGARGFARELRLELWREHLDRDDDDGLIDPADAVEAIRSSAAALDAWYAGGRVGPRPPGRLRTHAVVHQPLWKRLLATPPYHFVADPDGRPARLKLRKQH